MKKKQKILAFVILTIFDVLVMLCASGTFGEKSKIVSNVCFGLFGKMQFIMPVLVPVAAFLFLFHGKNRKIIEKTIFSLFVLLFFMVALHLEAYGNVFLFPATAFKRGFSWHNGGGFFGGAIAYGLLHMIGFAATKIVTAFAIVSFVALIFKSQVKFLFGKAISLAAKKINPGKAKKSSKSKIESIGKTAEEKPQKANSIKAAGKKSVAKVASKSASKSTAKSNAYEKPAVELLDEKPEDLELEAEENCNIIEENEKSDKIIRLLSRFSISAKIEEIVHGPAITRFEISVEEGTKLSKILSLKDELKIALAVMDVNILTPVPGKSVIGIEIPSEKKEIVTLKSILDDEKYKKSDSVLKFALGKDIGGKAVFADLEKMPHLLIAGSTGSGKSVCINTIIMSLLFNATPDEVKLLLIDPKMVELSVYEGIPHLLRSIVTDPADASEALKNAVAEMSERYKLFSEEKVRNIDGYNKKVPSGKKLSRLVIVIDELADLMMTSKKDAEESIVRLAQLARAAGIHLVIATQRPTSDVLTGLIKSNVPSRIAFAVASKIDSRVILDENGAENLLGHGDMLFAPQGTSSPMRIQGAFVPDELIEKVAGFLREI